MLYPLKFNPILLPKIWGGQQLKKNYNSTEKYENIGESWLVSAIDNNESVVAEGFLKDNTLPELVEVYLNELLGDKIYRHYGEKFPLLVKIIDASDNLSIQVHPNDSIAKKYHNSFGKNEMWYMLNCQENAFIYAGFKEQITKEQYKKAVEEGTIESFLKKHYVKKDDYLYIPAGCVHSIGKGCTILEIQQSSDITYRIYDYNRKDDKGNPRQIHTQEALMAIDFDNWQNNVLNADFIENQPVKIIDNQYFKTLAFYSTQTQELNLSEIDSCVLLSIIEGSLEVNHQGTKTLLNRWETTLIPATIDSLILNPLQKTKTVITYINSD